MHRFTVYYPDHTRIKGEKNELTGEKPADSGGVVLSEPNNDFSFCIATQNNEINNKYDF